MQLEAQWLEMADETLRGESDEALACRAASDPDAMTELYLRYRPRVERYCQHKLSDADLVQDVVAQVFLKVLDSLGKRRVSRFRPWLFTIVHNEIVTAYRSARPTIPLDPLNLTSHEQSSEVSAGDSFDLGYVRALMGCLSASERQVMELRLFGLTNQEICHVLNKSYSWVGSTQHRAFTALQQLVAANTRAEVCTP